MAKLNTSNPSGFPEFSPAQERVRQQWLAVIREVFEKYGFQPIETPLVEREENLLSKGGNAKEMYVLKRLHDEEGDSSHSGNAFRFDHTVPLALYVARHLNDITFPFKRYAIGPVLRGERAQKFRYRQFDQCDIDILGSESLSTENDAVCIAVMIEIFEKLNIGDFVVRINNRKIIKGLLEVVGIEEKDSKDVFDALDDLEKIGQEGVEKKLSAQGLSSDQVNTLLSVVNNGLGAISDKNNNIDEGTAEVLQVEQSLISMEVNQDRWVRDLSIIRGLDYYTGTVFETNLIGESAFGMSLCSGGRYDDLGETFTGRKTPGVGASIGLTRLLHMLFDAEVINTESESHLDVLVLPFASTEVSACMAFAQTLRKQGLKVDVYLEDKKIAKKFDYADKIGVEWVAIIGEDELKEGNVQLKNMKTKEQETISQEDAFKSLV